MPYKDAAKRRRLSRKRGGKQVKVKCDKCGKDVVIRYDSAHKYKRHFCSECKKKFLSELHTKEINEEAFIEEYLRYRQGYQTLACKFKIGGIRAKRILEQYGIPILKREKIKEKMIENGSGNWKKAIIKKCLNCDAPFKFHKGVKEFYCCTKCYLSHEEKFTTIEQKIAQLLDKNKISYERQFCLHGFYYDFLIPSIKTIIECDGDYWHGNPEKYEVLSEIQKHHKQRDRLKTHIAKKHDFTLLRFWENQINDEIEGVENEILSNIK